MPISNILGPALVVCVIIMLMCCSSESFSVHKESAIHDLVFKKNNNKTQADKAEYVSNTSKVSQFTGSLDDSGSVGHLNDMEFDVNIKAIQNYDKSRDAPIDSRWVPDMAIPMEMRSATTDDIISGNLQFGNNVEYDRTRWADTKECPQSYGLSSDTYGKIVFGDESTHNVPDNFRHPLIDDAQMVTYGDYGRGSVTV